MGPRGRQGHRHLRTGASTVPDAQPRAAAGTAVESRPLSAGGPRVGEGVRLLSAQA